MKILVIFKDNWADEMKINGFGIYFPFEWEQIEANLRKLDYPQAVYFGTNESKTYETADELLSHFHIKEIDESQAGVIGELFGNVSFGIFPDGLFEYE